MDRGVLSSAQREARAIRYNVRPGVQNGIGGTCGACASSKRYKKYVYVRREH